MLRPTRPRLQAGLLILLPRNDELSSNPRRIMLDRTLLSCKVSGSAAVSCGSVGHLDLGQGARPLGLLNCGKAQGPRWRRQNLPSHVATQCMGGQHDRT